MKTLIALLAVVTLAGQAHADTAVEFVEGAREDVLAILRNPSLDSPAKVKQLEQVAYSRFDFGTISRLVLARNWSKLTPEQQAQFVEEFKKHLSVTYGRNVDDYTNEDIAIVGDREEPRGDWTVLTKIKRGGGADILVDYRLRKVNGQWRVIDVIVERISLVSNFRSQLQEIVSRQGVDGMLALLREKNASGESILPKEKIEGGQAGSKAAS